MRVRIEWLSASRLIAVALAAVAGLAWAGPAATAKDDAAAWDAIVDAVVERYDLPGIAVGIIDHGEVVHVAVRGERRVGSGQRIDRDTLFKIASNSKAMTATLLARLVQQGRIRWDDPVRRHLPQFAMHDPWVSEHMQIGDLLVHRSGLPEGGGDLMLWPMPNHFNRADIINGLQYIKPAYDFRAGYAYDNLLYVVAGEAAAAAGGPPYAELLRREIFEPLGMRRCQAGEWHRASVGNVAVPHYWREGKAVADVPVSDTVEPSTMEAAGGIRCSLGDMLIWARNWLTPDTAQLRWLNAEQRRIEWTPYTPMPISDRRRAWDGTRLYAYGYGWRIADIDGELTVSHTGTLSGMYSAMLLLPDRKAGFVVLINADASAAREVLIQTLTNRFTQPGQPANVRFYADELEKAAEQHRESRVPDTSDRQPASATELSTWLGIWRSPWFGDVTLCAKQDAVWFASQKSPMLEGSVMRVNNRYLVQWTRDHAEAWLQFPETVDGSLRMAKVDPGADFSYDFEDLAFSRIADCAQAAAASP
ncbi:MAG: serine hydrolase [Xanthomonadales bacterium]|nr:serine hydrolase [Xanthomonadales bacterium]